MASRSFAFSSFSSRSSFSSSSINPAVIKSNAGNCAISGIRSVLPRTENQIIWLIYVSIITIFRIHINARKKRRRLKTKIAQVKKVIASTHNILKLFVRLLLVAAGGGLIAQNLHAAITLDVYFIDTEGGVATLIVTPAGESLLKDFGNTGERDAGRNARVALDAAGLK